VTLSGVSLIIPDEILIRYAYLVENAERKSACLLFSLEAAAFHATPRLISVERIADDSGG
jgi:hypothetical protein